MLIYFNTDTQYAKFGRNPLYQATKRHLTDKWSKIMKKERKRLKNDEKLKQNTFLFEPFCVWILF